MASRSELLWLANFQEQAALYNDMFNTMKQITLNTELTKEERNLFLIAAKNIVGDQRALWRVLSSNYTKLQQDIKDTKEDRKVICEDKKNQIGREITKFCMEVKDIATPLIERSSSPEARAFFHKMRADFGWYMVEVTTGEERQEYISQTTFDFEKSYEIMKNSLIATHPLLLELVNRYTAYCFEILNRPEMAVRIGKEVFSAAIEGLETLDEEDYRETIFHLSLTRDNLTLWSQELEDLIEHG